MKNKQGKKDKPRGRTPSRLGALIGDKYPGVSDLLSTKSRKKAKESVNASEVVNLLQKREDEIPPIQWKDRNCSTLDWTDCSLEKVKKGKDVSNNFEDKKSTRARDPENPLSLEAATGFLWPAKKRDYHSHIGEEAIYILSGKLRYRDILGNNLAIGRGDILRYRSELFHEVSSMSSTPVSGIVIWWGPRFRGSALGAKQPGPSYDPGTWSRFSHIPAYQQNLTIKRGREHDLEGAYKFCLGIPAMITCKVNAMGISRESLAKITGYTARYINELLDGFLDPSLDVLCTISEQLGFPSKHLIWRHEDSEPWVQLLRPKEYREGKQFDRGVISVKYKKLDISTKEFDYPIKQEDKTDRIFIVLKGGINLQRKDLYEKNSKNIAAMAGFNEAIYLRAGNDCMLFPLHREAELLEVSVAEHAETLWDWPQKTE